MKFFFSRRFEMALLTVSLSAVLYVVWPPFHENRQRSSCQSNLKQIALATFQYTRDYDERFMLAPNWKEAAWPYVKVDYVFSCPKNVRGYAYNAGLSGANLSTVPFKRMTQMALFYEPAWPINADGGKNWPTSGVHGQGSNVCFLDGHVKWMQAKPMFWTPEMASKDGQKDSYVAQLEAEAARVEKQIESSQKQELEAIKKQKRATQPKP